MKRFLNITLLIGISLLFIHVYGCDTVSTSIDTDTTTEQSILLETKAHQPTTGLKATGEFSARWQGCDDGDHEEPADHEEGECEGGHDGDEGQVDEDHNCTDDHGDEGTHDEEGYSGNRPARDFYVRFDAQVKKTTRGEVTFTGLGEYEGIDFNGSVTWVEPGRETNELFFGGTVTGGTVTRGCFLFSVQDNGEGINDEADRLQYRLYGSSNAPCHLPDHFPQGYPIAVYEGNLQVH